MPAPIAFEKWSEKAYQPASDGYTAQRAWNVLYVSSIAQALATVGVQINSSHPLNPLLKCNSLPVGTPMGPNLYEVRANYSVPAGGGNHPDGNGNTNPLAAPVEIEWGHTVESVPTERDALGNPIVNSARWAFDQPQQTDEDEWTFNIYRNEPFFDWLKARYFRNRVNASAITFLGYDMPIGCLKCTRYLPAQRFAPLPAPSFVPVVYSFSFRDPVDEAGAPSLANSPYNHWLQDIGYQGWYLDGSTVRSGPFVHVNAEGDATEVNDPVRLDGMGRPLDRNVIKVGLTDPQLAVSPVSPGTTPPPGAIIVPAPSGATGNFIVYRKHRSREFSLLGI